MLPFDVNSTLDEFLSRIVAYEDIGVIQDHALQNTKKSDYWFAGVVTPTNQDDLQILDSGDVKSGSLTVYVRSPRRLYIRDVQNETAFAKQTFIKYDNAIYRVTKELNWASNGMYRKYIAVRYVQDTTAYIRT